MKGCMNSYSLGVTVFLCSQILVMKKVVKPTTIINMAEYKILDSGITMDPINITRLSITRIIKATFMEVILEKIKAIKSEPPVLI